MLIPGAVTPSKYNRVELVNYYQFECCGGSQPHLHDMATRSGTPLVDDSDSRCLMPLPPGMVPSDSRENIIDLLPEGIKQENRFQVTFKTGFLW